ncbi:hypothetical protein AVEN_116465-1 [Araneus ventricosus]|uniref:Reverse transcriptase domain-containing protein n=1 Tax=Araneus ventricosus TaxID=182803 RepID=A0A4Y2UFH5_ARAVE|nr:hypothetical protein AVEN_116465-1 [Araneus ventricosus]
MFILDNNLFINNSSEAPSTFTRNTSKGWPDLSLCTQQIIGEIVNREVLEEPSLSDLSIEITIDSSVKNCTFTRYKTHHGATTFSSKTLNLMSILLWEPSEIVRMKRTSTKRTSSTKEFKSHKGISSDQEATLNIFKSLLKNRKIILNTFEGPAIRDQKQGYPQGSGSVPALWNLVANEILQENRPINTSIQAFADDFVLVSHAPTRVQLESQIKEYIAKFSTWASKNQLQILAEKSYYLLISKLIRGPTIRWQGERIKRAHAIKYLGVYIDEKMYWNTYIE